jgi:hypothetical protein
VCRGPFSWEGAELDVSNIVIDNYIIQSGNDVSNNFRIIATEIIGTNNQIELISFMKEEKKSLKEYTISSGAASPKQISLFQIDNRYLVSIQHYYYDNRSTKLGSAFVWDIKEFAKMESDKTLNSMYNFRIETEDDILFLDGSKGIMVSAETFHGGMLAYTIIGERIYIPNITFARFFKVSSKYWHARDSATGDQYLIDISSLKSHSTSIRSFKLPGVYVYAENLIHIDEVTFQFFTQEQSLGYYLYTFTDGIFTKKTVPFFSPKIPINIRGIINVFQYAGNRSMKYHVYLNGSDIKDERGNMYIFNIKAQTGIFIDVDWKSSIPYHCNSDKLVFIPSSYTTPIRIVDLPSATVSTLLVNINEGIIFLGGLSDGTFFIRLGNKGTFSVTNDTKITKIDSRIIHHIKEIPDLNRIVMLIEYGTSLDKGFVEIWS